MDGPWDLDEIERWAAGARAAEAADARLREHGLRRQAEEATAMCGLLLDLAERKAAVIVVTTTGHHLVGRLHAVGADFVAVGTGPSRTTLVAQNAIGAVRMARADGGHSGRGRLGPISGARDGGRAPARAVTIADVLAHAVGRRPRMRFQTGAGMVAGELRSIGADVISVHVDGDPPGLAYVRLASVSEVSFLDSG
ncbi:MAG: hypothetical protein ACR2HY_05180 [Acidimicrobiales bacterium]